MATSAHWVQAGRFAVVFDLDLGAIRSAAKTHVTTPGDMATAATLATDATPPTQSVAVVATVAMSPAVATVFFCSLSINQHGVCPSYCQQAGYARDGSALPIAR